MGQTLPYDFRSNQEKAVNTVFKLISEGNKKVFLELAAGTGRSVILVELIRRLILQGTIHKVLILCITRATADLYVSKLYNSTSFLITRTLALPVEKQVTVITYSQLNNNIKDFIDNFDLVIGDDIRDTTDESVDIFFQNSSLFFIGILSPGMMGTSSWLNEVSVAYKYSIADAIEDGYLVSPREYARSVEEFFYELIKLYGYDVKLNSGLSKNNKTIEPDLIASNKEQNIIFEIKAYRDRYISKNVVNNALMQIVRYKEAFSEYEYYLVLLCEIDSRQKKEILDQYNIVIWDIANILYVCENSGLISELSEIIYFPISDIKSEKPERWNPPLKKEKEPEIKKFINRNTCESLEERISACRPGNETAIEYEKICTEIIRFLFETEFTQSTDQHKTSDDLFRMDLLCGIKDRLAFWELLIKHFNTRFIVFEYKNYEDFLSQNLIYTTEKYLFNAALRNVAFIVSRKGFSAGANKAAMGCLKENNKLIISLTDDDLIKMMHMKIDGEEPSEYLLNKLESLLMSVGK